jgi:hypothetical protein
MPTPPFDRLPFAIKHLRHRRGGASAAPSTAKYIFFVRPGRRGREISFRFNSLPFRRGGLFFYTPGPARALRFAPTGMSGAPPQLGATRVDSLGAAMSNQPTGYYASPFSMQDASAWRSATDLPLASMMRDRRHFIDAVPARRAR